MKPLIPILLLSIFVSGCQASTIQMSKDENTKLYSKIQDPIYGKVHSFQFESECGNLERNSQSAKETKGTWFGSDCEQNRSVRSEISEKGRQQPKEAWYRWNVYLPNDFPIQPGGKLTLGQFHNGECPHVSLISPGGSRDYGMMYFETLKTGGQWNCETTQRIPFYSIQRLRGKWTEFVMFARWSNKSDGLFQIYIDGEQVLDYKGRTLTKGKENSNYVKVGIYQCCNGDNPRLPASALFTTPERSTESLLPK